MRLIDSITQYPGLENLKNMTNAWNKLIAEKSIPFDPEVLKEAIGKEVKTICLPKNGKKVLKIEKKGECYTRLMSTKYPVGHYEIALAVFIQKLNDSCYAQFTLTGNTENWDILNIYSDNSAEFIELKEWDSKDSPLFALVEALKNFELYNHISKLNKAQHTQFSDSSISILAPIEYYIKYNLFSPFINKYTSNEFSDLIKACKECFMVDIHLKPKSSGGASLKFSSAGTEG